MPHDLPKVILRARRALPFFSRHPWVFAGAVDRIEGSPAAGAEVALYSHEGQFIARGLYNPVSNIRVRLYGWDEHSGLDDFWSQRIDEAISLRRDVLNCVDVNSACRLVYSEADGLSGLIVDWYAGWLVIQLTSRALADRRQTLVDLLKQKLAPRGIWLRTEKGIGKTEGLEISDGLVDGSPPPRPLFIEEHGVRFGVDVQQGHKTGFYLDQRDNRRTVAGFVRDRRVLDLFCYTGGFGLAAAVTGEARHVLGIDASESAIATARANAELNGAGSTCTFERSDVFSALERLTETGERFACVVLDPPKLARQRSGVKRALRGYHSLNELAAGVLQPGGVLVTCSCSGHVSRETFDQMLAKVAVAADRPLQILEARGQAPDHPTSVHCPENNYLKCRICRVI